MMRKVLFLFGLLTLVACKPSMEKKVYQGLVQGSFFAVTYYDEQGRDFKREIDSVFHAIDLSVNLWVDSSVICKVNRNEEVVLDDIFIDNFNIGQEAARISGGYFDPTISPLVSAWGFSAKQGVEVSPSLVDSLRQLVDYRKVHLEDGKVVKEDPAMQLDFNAIAQGYTADAVASLLASKGVSHYLVDVGGEIAAHGGKPEGKSWIVGIEKPASQMDAEVELQSFVSMTDGGLVTSGSTRKYVERDGKRYSHCIDPMTGYPVDHQVLSVTVKAKNSVWADAYASMGMVMGMEKSLALFETLEDVEAYYIFVNAQGELETFATEGFKIMEDR